MNLFKRILTYFVSATLAFQAYSYPLVSRLEALLQRTKMFTESYDFSYKRSKEDKLAVKASLLELKADLSGNKLKISFEIPDEYSNYVIDWGRQPALEAPTSLLLIVPKNKNVRLKKVKEKVWKNQSEVDISNLFEGKKYEREITVKEAAIMGEVEGLIPLTAGNDLEGICTLFSLFKAVSKRLAEKEKAERESIAKWLKENYKVIEIKPVNVSNNEAGRTYVFDTDLDECDDIYFLVNTNIARKAGSLSLDQSLIGSPTKAEGSYIALYKVQSEAKQKLDEALSLSLDGTLEEKTKKFLEAYRLYEEAFSESRTEKMRKLVELSFLKHHYVPLFKSYGKEGLMKKDFRLVEISLKALKKVPNNFLDDEALALKGYLEMALKEKAKKEREKVIASADRTVSSRSTSEKKERKVEEKYDFWQSLLKLAEAAAAAYLIYKGVESFTKASEKKESFYKQTQSFESPKKSFSGIMITYYVRGSDTLAASVEYFWNGSRISGRYGSYHGKADIRKWIDEVIENAKEISKGLVIKKGGRVVKKLPPFYIDPSTFSIIRERTKKW